MRIKENSFHQIDIEKSKFICFLGRCFSEEEAREFIKKIKKEHPLANHHCTAFILNKGLIMRTSDDGEPSGTAGKPMLDALVKNDIMDVCAIVVRYFGGIKLGAGGLTRAYSKSVSECIKISKKVEVKRMNHYRINFSYEYTNKIEFLFRGIVILNKEYEEQVVFEYIAESDYLNQRIQEITKGQHEPTLIDIIEIEVDI